MLVFAEGDTRVAGNSSVWLFHGVWEPMRDWRSPMRTQQFVDMLKDAGISEEFLCDLVAEGYLTKPGEYWMSGYELFHNPRANLIHRLLPAWDPE